LSRRSSAARSGPIYFEPRAAWVLRVSFPSIATGHIVAATEALDQDQEPQPSGNGARAMTVFVYVNTAKQVGDKDHIKVFSNLDAAEKWFEDNDPEGVAFEYEVLE
jgi:hypothetical protein